MDESDIIVSSDTEPDNLRDALIFSIKTTLVISAGISLATSVVGLKGGLISFLWNMSIIAVTIFCLLMAYFFLRVIFIKQKFSQKKRDTLLTLIPFIIIALLLGIVFFFGANLENLLFFIGLIAAMIIFSLIAGKGRLFD